MKKWLKGIGIFAAALIALEVIAYVGLTLLGPTAFRDMVEILRPIGDPTPAIATQMDNGAQQKCSTYMGELFCITDEAPVPADNDATPGESLTRAEPLGPRRCAEYHGETICIEGGS
jgi:hypothetical protein